MINEATRRAVHTKCFYFRLHLANVGRKQFEMGKWICDSNAQIRINNMCANIGTIKGNEKKDANR